MLKVVNLSKSYSDTILDHINLDIEEVGIHTIIGESGAGKTTLLQMIAGIDQDYEGDIYLNSKNIKAMSSKELIQCVSIVYQDFKLHENLTVYENLNIIPFNHITESRILDIIRRLNLEKELYKKVYDLSGGQKQRVAIARSLLVDCPIICFDEPTSGLDKKNYNDLMKIIYEIADTKIILLITHDERVIDDSDIVYELKDGALQQISLERLNNKKISETKKLEFNPKNIKNLFFKRNLKSSINTFCLYFVFVLIFITSFVIVNAYISANVNMWSSNIDNQSIHMNTQKLNDGNIDITHLFWNDEDLSKIASIDNVTNVIPFEESSTLFVDSEMNALDDYSYKFKNNIDSTKLSFETVAVPKEIYMNYGYYKPDIIAGEYPENDSDALLIPDIIAYDLNTDYEKLVGTKVELPVKNLETDADISKEYPISGIYRTINTGEVADNYVLYTGNVLDYYDSGLYSPSKQNYDEINPDMTYDEYIKSVGLGLPDILIKVDSPKHISGVEEKLQKMYPEYKIETQKSYTNGLLSNSVRKIVFIKNISYIIIILIFTILNYFLFQEYFKNRAKEYFINTSIGYSRITLVKNLMYEFIIKNAVIFMLIMFALLLIARAIPANFAIITANIITVGSIVLIMVFIILINVLNLTLFLLKTKDRERLVKMLKS